MEVILGNASNQSTLTTSAPNVPRIINLRLMSFSPVFVAPVENWRIQSVILGVTSNSKAR